MPFLAYPVYDYILQGKSTWVQQIAPTDIPVLVLRDIDAVQNMSQKILVHN